MSDKIEYSRLLIKRSGLAGIEPTINPITEPSLKDLLPTDIFVGEFFLNSSDGKLWLRTTDTDIEEISFTGSTGGTQNLSSVLNEGNSTSGNNIFITSGDTIQFEDIKPDNDIRLLVGLDTFGSTVGVDPKSLFPKAYYGQVYNITGQTLSIDTSGTYQEMKISTSLDLSDGLIAGVNYSMGLRNDTTEDLLIDLYGSADIDAGNSKRLGIKLAINGVPFDETECNVITGVSGSFGKLQTSWMVILKPDDEVSLFVTNFTNTGNITIERAKLVGKRILTNISVI